MPALAEVASQQWTWVEPAPPQRWYALRAGEQELASLRFEKECETCATGRCGSDQWSFRRNALPHPRVIIRDCASQEEIAVFDFHILGGGAITFHSGTRFSWRTRNIWSTRWGFFREKEEILCLEQNAGILENTGRVTVSAPSAGLPELPLLLLLAWYLRVLSYEHLANAIIASE